MDYYKKAIEYIIERVTDAVIFVFSDDMDWCREHICTSGSPVIFVDLQSEQTCYHDMHLMSLCSITSSRTLHFLGGVLGFQRKVASLVLHNNGTRSRLLCTITHQQRDGFGLRTEVFTFHELNILFRTFLPAILVYTAFCAEE